MANSLVLSYSPLLPKFWKGIALGPGFLNCSYFGWESVV